MYTHSYSGFTKYAKTYTISKYKATCKIRNCYVCKKITNTAVWAISCYNLLNHMLHLFTLSCTPCMYLLYPAHTVYPADTMLFIQLIRYCLSSWYYVVYPADTIVTVICFYTMLCICDKYLFGLVCIGFAYIIYILQDTYNTLFFNNPDNLFNRY